MTPLTDRLDNRLDALELFPGCAIALTYSDRDTILAEAARGNLEHVEAIFQQRRQTQTPYLAELFGMPVEAPAEDIWDALRSKRALNCDLPADTSLEVVLAVELKRSRSLTMRALQIERDKRLGTHIPLVNDGHW